MKKLAIVLLLSGCSWAPMTLEQRVAFNDGPFLEECVFDSRGEALSKPCLDLRLQVTSVPPGLYNEALEYQGKDTGVVHHVLPMVSATEVVCYAMMVEKYGKFNYYPRACAVDNHIYYTVGDTVAMDHEVCHTNGACEHG